VSTRHDNITGQEVQCLVTGCAYWFDNGESDGSLPFGYHVEPLAPINVREWETVTYHWQTRTELKRVIEFCRESGVAFAVNYQKRTIQFESTEQE